MYILYYVLFTVEEQWKIYLHKSIISLPTNRACLAQLQCCHTFHYTICKNGLKKKFEIKHNLTFTL